MTPKRQRLTTYWIATAAVVAGIAWTGLLDVTTDRGMALHVTALGYPPYLQSFLGLAKILGALAIALPGLARLKEWAYAGVCFDLLGATYSHIANHDAPSELALPLALLALAAASYLLRPDSRRLPNLPADPALA